MADTNSFDVNGARQAGYSDDEILQHLTSSRKFDVAGALKAGYSKQDIIQHLATTPAPAAPSTPAAPAQQKQYAPGRAFGMDVARGMGLNADKIAAAEDKGGQLAGLQEIGSQVLDGLKNLAMDPLSPITGSASNFEAAVKSGSPGRIVGALSSILGGAESANKVPGVAGAAADLTAKIGRNETGALRPTAKAVSSGVGAAVGHATGIPGAEVAGLWGGPKIADAIIPSREPSVGKPVNIRTSPYFDADAYKAGRQSAGQSTAPAASPADMPPTMPRIVDPNSPAPAINRTLVSYPRDVLAALARSGDVDALKELIRNPAGIDVNQAVPGWRYLIEPGQTRVYGGPNGASAGLGPNLSDIFKR